MDLSTICLLIVVAVFVVVAGVVIVVGGCGGSGAAAGVSVVADGVDAIGGAVTQEKRGDKSKRKDRVNCFCLFGQAVCKCREEEND